MEFEQDELAWPEELPRFVAVDAGSFHALALDEEGFLWAWGRNEVGEVGDGTGSMRLTAVPVRHSSGEHFGNVVAFYAGSTRSFAIDTEGQLWGWGQNFMGSLGIGEYYNARTPQRLHYADGRPFDNVVSVASGNSYGVAVRGDGSVWMWGRLETIIDGIAEEPHIFPEERYGHPKSLYPVQIRHADGRPFTEAVQVSAFGDWHTLVLTEDNQVWGWGSADLLAPLPGYREIRRYAPAPELSMVGEVSEPHRITGIATTQTHSVALLDDGTALSWGGNRYGQLGHGTTIMSAGPNPARIQSPQGRALEGVAEIALTHFGTLVLLTDGTVHYIGGQAQGNGEYVEEVERHTPAIERWSQVTHPDGTPFDGVVSIGAGFYSAHLITEDGRIHSFGLNMSGPLGDGTEEDRYYPVPLVYVANPGEHHFLDDYDYEEDEWWD